MVFVSIAVRRHLPRVQPVPGDRAPAAVAEPAVSGAARALARRRRAAGSSPGSSSSAGWGEDPATLVTAALGYTLLTLAAQVYLGVETWTRRGEAFAVYYDMFARMSIWEVRDGVLGVRRPLGGLPRLDKAAGTVAFVTVMIGTVTFDGLSQGQLWRDVSADVVDTLDGLGIGALTASKIAATFGLLLGVGLVAGFYRLGIEGARSVGGGLSFAQARVRLHPHARPDRGGLRRRALPDVPRLRGPGDHLPGLGPVRAGLGPVRHGQLGDRLHRLPAGGHLVRAGRGGRRSATSRR